MNRRAFIAAAGAVAVAPVVGWDVLKPERKRMMFLYRMEHGPSNGPLHSVTVHTRFVPDRPVPAGWERIDVKGLDYA